MRAEQHVWATADGQLVATGHPGAMVLRYAPGDEIAEADQAALAALALAGEKELPKPADKARARPTTKERPA